MIIKHAFHGQKTHLRAYHALQIYHLIADIVLIFQRAISTHLAKKTLPEFHL